MAGLVLADLSLYDCPDQRATVQVIGRGRTERRILQCSVRYGLTTQPASSVRGSSRRIMTMRYPTRAYQSDQSSRMLLGCHRPCCPKRPRGTKPTVSFPFGIPILPSTRLQAHQRERVPAKPPVEAAVDARTVLAVKGSLRRAKHRRALDVSAPFRPNDNRDGRLRREHFTAAPKTKGRLSSCGGKPA